VSEVREGSTSFVTINFYDQNGAAVTPSAAKYQLMKNGLEILAWASFTPSSSSHTITITAAQNARTVTGSYPETMVVTFEWTYGTGSYTGTGEVSYQIVNLENYP